MNKIIKTILISVMITSCVSEKEATFNKPILFKNIENNDLEVGTVKEIPITIENSKFYKITDFSGVLREYYEVDESTHDSIHKGDIMTTHIFCNGLNQDTLVFKVGEKQK